MRLINILFVAPLLFVLIITGTHAADLDALTKPAKDEHVEIEKFFFKAHRPVDAPAQVTDKMKPVTHDPAIQSLSEITNYRQYIVWNIFSLHYQDTKQWLSGILNSHYKPSADDPGYIKQDLDDIASYYSQFPDVVKLISLIEYRKWTLMYKPKASYTKAIGSMFGVDSAVIYFDSRAAVQHMKHRSCKGSPVCTSSPADVVLHELIHAAVMLTTNEFIEDGGMHSSVYPFKHEHKVIQLESQLYRRMSEKDSYRRPIRKEHSGKYIPASCVTCIN